MSQYWFPPTQAEFFLNIQHSSLALSGGYHLVRDLTSIEVFDLNSREHYSVAHFLAKLEPEKAEFWVCASPKFRKEFGISDDDYFSELSLKFPYGDGLVLSLTMTARREFKPQTRRLDLHSKLEVEAPPDL